LTGFHRSNGGNPDRSATQRAALDFRISDPERPRERVETGDLVRKLKESVGFAGVTDEAGAAL
jgi:hypothetical protein